MEVLIVLITVLGTAIASCVPYNGPHLNESAWQNIPENVSVLICQDMVPRRCDPLTLEYVPAQETQSPFHITTSNQTVNIGSTLQVSVSGELGFNSIYIQARNGDEPEGQFLRTQDTFTSNCSGDYYNAASFTSKELVKEANITWIAPEDPVRVQFRATISRSFEEFWVGVTSPTVTVKAADYGLEGKSSVPDSGGMQIFLHPYVSRLALGLTLSPLKLVPGLSWG